MNADTNKDKNNIELMMKQIEDGIEQIMQLSFPLCKSSDLVISDICCNINNTAFDLKKKLSAVLSQIKNN